jgi:hypothetical protein
MMLELKDHMYTYSPLSLGQWGAVNHGCPMMYGIRDDGTAVDFTFGESGSQYVEFGFETDALREFLEMAAKALEEVDTAASQNAQEQDATA